MISMEIEMDEVEKEITVKFNRSVTVSLIVAIAFFMQFLDTTAVNTAIPAMARSFRVDVIHLSTGVTSYLIALAIFIPDQRVDCRSFWYTQCFLYCCRFFYFSFDIMRDICILDSICSVSYYAGNGGCDDVSCGAFGCIVNYT